jgi:signal peptidase I
MGQKHLQAVTDSVTERLDKEGEAIFRVTGESMSPQIRINDLVKIRNVPFQDITCGDIVVFQQGNEYITHRYLEMQEDHFLTRGDKRVLPDPLIHKNQFTGMVVEIKRSERIFDLLQPQWVNYNRRLGQASLVNVTWINSMTLRLYHPYFTEGLRIPVHFFQRMLSFPFRVRCNVGYWIQRIQAVFF